MSRSYGKVSDPAAAERYRTNICVTSAPRFTPKLFPLNRFFFSLSTVTCKTIYIKKKKWNPQLKVAVCSAAFFCDFFFFDKRQETLPRRAMTPLYDSFQGRSCLIWRGSRHWKFTTGSPTAAKRSRDELTLVMCWRRGGGSIGIIFFAQIYHASARCCRPNGTSSSYKKPQSWRVMGLMSRVLEDTPTATTSMGMTSQSRYKADDANSLRFTY